jgi:hypothetical protein
VIDFSNVLRTYSHSKYTNFLKTWTKRLQYKKVMVEVVFVRKLLHATVYRKKNLHYIMWFLTIHYRFSLKQLYCCFKEKHKMNLRDFLQRFPNNKWQSVGDWTRRKRKKEKTNKKYKMHVTLRIKMSARCSYYSYMQKFSSISRMLATSVTLCRKV